MRDPIQAFQARIAEAARAVRHRRLATASSSPAVPPARAPAAGPQRETVIVIFDNSTAADVDAAVRRLVE